jgi:hypothetical protein
MITVRQIERLWLSRDYTRIARLCLEIRPEASVRLALEVSRQAPVAALAVIKLDDLGQSYAPFCARLIRCLLGSQEADGGWGDPVATALAIKALSCGNGQGVAVERAITYLADLQKSDGLWPRIPLRRLPSEPFTSAFILYTLHDNPAFTSSVRFEDALTWFDHHATSLDPETDRLYRSLTIRLNRATAPQPLWS